MLEDHERSGIPALDENLPTLRRLATAGFIFVHDITFWGPEFYHSEYPKVWQAEYERRSYAHFDPVVLWAMTNVGDRRWSDIRLLDLRGVMKAARRHGLNYGVCLVRAPGGRRSFMTAARADREFTDVELAFLGATLDALLVEVERSAPPALTSAEVQTLRCMRDGMSHSEAADVLQVSVPAIKARLKSCRDKLGARSATQAVARAIQRRLI